MKTVSSVGALASTCMMGIARKFQQFRYHKQNLALLLITMKLNITQTEYTQMF